MTGTTQIQEEDINSVVEDWVNELMRLNPKDNDSSTRYQLTILLREETIKKAKKEGWLVSQVP